MEQWIKRQECLTAITEREAQRGTPYETFLRVRLDIMFFAEVPPSLRLSLRTSTTCTIFVPEGEDHGRGTTPGPARNPAGLNDRMIFADRCGMERDADIFEFMATSGNRAGSEVWNMERTHAENIYSRDTQVLRTQIASCLVADTGTCRHIALQSLALSTHLVPDLIQRRPELCGPLLQNQSDADVPCTRARQFLPNGQDLVQDPNAQMEDEGFCDLQRICVSAAITSAPLVVIYSGRWDPDNPRMLEAIASQKENLIGPLSEDGRRRVIVAFAGTASQWCWSEVSRYMPDGRPTAEADRQLQAQLQRAFGEEMDVRARTFDEMNLTSIDAAVAAIAALPEYIADYGFHNASTLRHRQARVRTFAAQAIGMARAFSIVDDAGEHALIARARLDVNYTDPWHAATYNASVVLAEPDRCYNEVVDVDLARVEAGLDPEEMRPESCFPFRDYSYIFSGTRCLNAITSAASSASIEFALAGNEPSLTSVVQPPWERMFAGLYPESQFELQLVAHGCDMAVGTTQMATELLKSDNAGGRLCGRATWNETRPSMA